ncbi:MAG: hypothetical protein WCV83_03960 [Candidatus Magasanikbacteria bacterium]
MNTKPKINPLSIKQIITKVLAILLILANPVAVSAKSIDSEYHPYFFSVTTTDIRNTTPFSSNNDGELVGNLDSDEDLEKAQRLDAYFSKRDMPLAGYGIEFVRAANKYNVDWRLIAAIGVRESSGGKHMMNNNPFGWGSAKIKFDDFSEAIDVVTSNLGGFNPNTARYYKNTDTKKKLWYYNGTVMPTYPAEVISIMNMV